MEQWAEIRRRVLVEKISQRQVLHEMGMRWNLPRKILARSEPHGYRQDVAFSKPKFGPFRVLLPRRPCSSLFGRTCFLQILEEDRRVPKTQRHMAKRIFERILIGNSGTGKSHPATGMAFAACQQGRWVRYFTAT